MGNINKQKARKKRYKKAMNFKKNNLPDSLKGLRMTSKIADSIFYKANKNK